MSCRLAMAFSALAWIGCGSDSTGAGDPTGVLIARWGGSLCAEDGVVQLSLTLADAETRVVCGSQEHRFDAVAVGEYDLTVQYLGDAGALPVDDGNGNAVNQLTFHVLVEATTDRTVFVGANVLGPGIDGGVPEPDADLPDPPPDPTDDDGDAVVDQVDNCVGVFNPDQLDTDQDKTGNACDCAPTDADLEVTVLDDALDADASQFTPVDGSWTYFGGVYRQEDSNGLARAWRPADDLGMASIATAIRITGTGTGAIGGGPFAGVVLRAAGFATGPLAGTSYVCGTDGAVLYLGTMDAGAGSIMALASQVLPFTLSAPAPLHASAKDDELTCRITNPANSGEWVEVTAVDSTYSGGATGLITNGMTADYEFALICSEE